MYCVEFEKGNITFSRRLYVLMSVLYSFDGTDMTDLCPYSFFFIIVIAIQRFTLPYLVIVGKA